MKRIMIIGVLLLAMAACRKSTTTTAAPDAFIFGSDGGFCQLCSSSYMIGNRQIFEDSVYGSPSIFHTAAMADSAYQQAKSLISSLPAYLLQHPDITTGCGGCADEPVLHIFYITGRDTLYWNLDTQSPSLPAEVTAYITQVQTVLGKLQ